MKCPKCGSRKVAPIMYGLPAWSKDLEERLKNKKLVLGGCCISDNDPRYYCFGCEQKIGYPAHYEDVVSISFACGGWRPRPTVRMEKERLSVTVSVLAGETMKYQWEMSLVEWDGILKRLYEKFYLAEWKKEYSNLRVIDGCMWDLKIGMKDRTEITYSGSNAYPPYWNEFSKLFRIYFEGRSEYTKDYVFIRFPGSMKIYNPWSDCTGLTSMQKAEVYEMYKRFGLSTEILKRTGRQKNNTEFGKKMAELERRMAWLIESCSEEELKLAREGCFAEDKIITLSRGPWAKIWVGGEIDSCSGNMLVVPIYVSFDLKEAYNIHNECKKHLTEEQRELLRAEGPHFAALTINLSRRRKEILIENQKENRRGKT